MEFEVAGEHRHFGCIVVHSLLALLSKNGIVQSDIRGQEIFCIVTPCNDGSQSSCYNLFGHLSFEVEEIVATFVSSDHNLSAAKFHIQARLESEFEATGERRILVVL